MANQVQNINNNIKPGTCPHGLPAAACPVCSASGGGTRLSDRNRKIGEMTYHECAMIGNMLKAAALARKHHEQSLKLQASNIEAFQNALTRFAAQMKEFSNVLSKNIITKPLAFVVNFITLPLLNFTFAVFKLPLFINNIKFEIMDKLNAIFGEIKAFLNKKIEQISEVIKKIGGWIFKIFKKSNTDDEDTKIDEDKKLFNLKNVISKLKEKFKNKKDKNDELCTEN